MVAGTETWIVAVGIDALACVELKTKFAGYAVSCKDVGSVTEGRDLGADACLNKVTEIAGETLTWVGLVGDLTVRDRDSSLSSCC